MSKRSKKRNKPYTGQDAKAQGPVVHRYQAVERSPLAEWWHERGRMVKLGAGIGGGALFFGWLMFELVRLVF